MPRSNSFPWEKFLPDLIFVFAGTFFIDDLIHWQFDHLVLSGVLLMLLNTLAVSLACYNFFSAYADKGKLFAYTKSLSRFEKAVAGISAFISCVGFLWWLVPFAAMKAMGVVTTGFIFGATIYFVCFMSVVATSIRSRDVLKEQNSPLVKMLTAFINGFFFFFSYAFLFATLPAWHPQFIVSSYAAVLCMVIFYLPLRFFLLLRPPFHRLEYFVFVTSFFVMLVKLFVNF